MMKSKFKKILVYLLLVVTLFQSIHFNTTPAQAGNSVTIVFGSKTFSDISSSDWFYQDVMTLVKKSVINGYTDNSFKPGQSVSVAEFIKMCLVANNHTITSSNTNPWYSKYTETALTYGYIDDGYYTNFLRPITRGEMGSIIDRMLNLQYDNRSMYIKQIADYTSIENFLQMSSIDVYIAGIITGYNDSTIRTANQASRAEAATVIIRMIDASRRKLPVIASEVQSNTSGNLDNQAVTKGFSIEGIEIGMSLSYLLDQWGTPTEILKNQYGYDWYVFAADYKKFKMIGIKGGVVVSLFSNQVMDSKLGIGIGSSMTAVKNKLSIVEFDDYLLGNYDAMTVKFFMDAIDKDGVEAIFVQDSLISHSSTYSSSIMKNIEKEQFYLINATRVKFGLGILAYSNEARQSAYLHSKDMVDKGYFGHTDPMGLSSKERMIISGVKANYYGENLAGGYGNSFEIHYALMNSPGHRSNVLIPEFDHLGVGFYYSDSAKYDYYLTENYFRAKDQ